LLARLLLGERGLRRVEFVAELVDLALQLPHPRLVTERLVGDRNVAVHDFGAEPQEFLDAVELVDKRPECVAIIRQVLQLRDAKKIAKRSAL
jgi:hypothetical protein